MSKMRYPLLAAMLWVALAENQAQAAQTSQYIAVPSGGEVYVVGQTQQVKVLGTPYIKTATVELSRDGGLSFEHLGVIENAKIQRSGSTFIWTVTGPISSKCLIRVSSIQRTGENTLRSMSFTIVNAVNSAGSSGAGELADGSVTNPKLADKAVTWEKVGSSQASNGMLLAADGNGGALWTTPPASAQISPAAGNSVVQALNDPATTTAFSGTLIAPGTVPNTALQSDAITVNAGTGLTGGGTVPLGGNTQLSLNNTGVTAGTYTRATLTVDAQGRLTQAATSAALDLSTETQGVLPITKGGTGSTTASAARQALNAASAGQNSDITSLSNLTAQDALQLQPFGTNSGQTSQIRFFELSANGSNYAALKAPDAMTANTIWTLPAADGLGGQVLATDGSGRLTWTSTGGTGTVSSVATSAGLTGGTIVGTGTIGLNLNANGGLSKTLGTNNDELGLDFTMIPKLSAANSFIGTQTIQSAAANQNALVVNGVTGQTLALQDWRVNGATVATIEPDGTFTGKIPTSALPNNVPATTLNGQNASFFQDASNLNAGTLSDDRLGANVTVQGNTFNTANKLVQLDANAKLPAVDGSNLTNIAATTAVSATTALNATNAVNATNATNATNAQNATLAADASLLNGEAGAFYQNASNLNAGTLADARLGTNVTLQGNTFNAANKLVQLDANSKLPTVDGSNLTNVAAATALSATTAASASDSSALNGQAASYYRNATNLNAGTVNDARLSSNVTVQGNTFNGASQLVQLDANSKLPAVDGSSLTNVAAATAVSATSAASASDSSALNGQAASYYRNATNLNAGTVNDARLSTNVTVQGNTFNGSNQLVQLDANTKLPAIDGSNLTNVAAATAATASNASALNGQAASYYLNATNVSAGTLADARLSTSVTLQGNTFNAASKLVQLDANTKLPAVDGSNLTNIAASTLNGQNAAYYQNASNTNAGTLADARLSSNVTLKGNTFNGASQLVSLDSSAALPVINTTGSGNVLELQKSGSARVTVDNSGNTTLAGSLNIGGGATILKVLNSSATLDFPATLIGNASDLTISVPGAALSDPVFLGTPDAVMLNDCSYVAWVSSADTVKIRFRNNGLSLARDPASSTFKVTVFKH